MAPNFSRFYYLFIFTNDSLLFLKATSTCARHILDVLEKYDMTFGQNINRVKFVVVFSLNTISQLMSDISSLLEIPKKDFHEKYLVLSPFIGRNKTRAFNKLKDKLSNLTHKWQEKPIYGVGNNILIKAIAQSILLFAMSSSLNSLKASMMG